MGLAATQVRLLSLTARQHAVEYDAQRIEAQKLQLANESDRVYSDYLAALDATKVQYKFVDDDGSYMFRDATFDNLSNAGFLFYVEGEICESFADVKRVLGTDKGTPETAGGKGIVDITATDSYTLLSTLVSEGLVVIMQQVADPETGYTYRVADTSASETNGWIVYNAGKGSAEEKFKLNDTDTKTGEKYGFKVFQNTSVASSTKLEEVADETSLKKAEAQYESDMNRINSKDARYDNELSQLETERNAIKTELETLEQVAKDNVDRTFKIFT